MFLTEVENNKRKSSTTWILPVLTRIFKLQPDDDLVQSLTLPDQKAVDIGFAFSSPLTIAVEFQKEAPRRSNAAAGSDVLGAPPGSAVFEKGAPTRCNAAAEPAAPARRVRQKQQPPGGAVTAPEAEAAAPQKVQARLLRRQKGEAKGGARTKGRQLSLLLPINLPHPLSRIQEMVLQSLLAKSAGSLCHLVLSLVAPNAITTLKSDAPRADQKLDW